MWTSMESPVGALQVIANRTAIIAIEFAGPKAESESKHSSINRASAFSAGRPMGERDDSNALLVEAMRQLTGYFTRDLKEFDLPLEPAGTTFQLSVWEQLGPTEIAQVLGVSANAVSIRLYRARKNLKTELGKPAPPGGHEESTRGRLP